MWDTVGSVFGVDSKGQAGNGGALSFLGNLFGQGKADAAAGSTSGGGGVSESGAGYISKYLGEYA